MWRLGNIFVMVLGAVAGGAVAAGGYISVGTLIVGANSADGMSPELAVVFGLIAAAVGAVIGLVASLAAAAILLVSRRSAHARKRVSLATTVAVLSGSAALAWLLQQLDALIHNFVIIGVCALIIAILASTGLSLYERSQRRRGASPAR